MDKEINKENCSEGAATEKNTEDGKTTTVTINVKHDESYPTKKLKSKLRFWGYAIAIMAIFTFGVYVGCKIMERDPAFGRPLKFMEVKEELSTEQFETDPIESRDWAWDAEDVPSFINSDYQKAVIRKYDGVEYNFGENKIRVEEEFMSKDLELTVNFDFGWSMSNFSIYASEDNIVIYGYWNDEFRRIVVGKTEDSIVREVLTLNPGVPFSANSKYITEDAKKDYIFVISEDMQTVSAYKDNEAVGESVTLPDEILGFYDGIMILAKADDYTDKLYMPYVVNNGNEEFICIEVAEVTATEVKNVSTDEYIDTFQSYTTKYSAWIGYVGCYIFENEDGMIRMIVPNEIQKYAAYRRGTDTLKIGDDLGWHWIVIQE